MNEYKALDRKILISILDELQYRYNEFKSRQLKLDISRGKPCPEQLDLSMDILKKTAYLSADGTDCRNYGLPDGLPEAKKLFSELLDVKEEEIIINGNSSLNLMHDLIARALLVGVNGIDRPWRNNGSPAIKFLCPSPGYDRHFAICELFGIDMITIDMNNDGPDMDTIEKFVSSDELIKGIWCVPSFSNPDGINYSDETVMRLAGMKTKAADFRIFWDNAYAFHHFTERPSGVMNILNACKKTGYPDRAFIFCSTSKMTFAGAGVSMVASSESNIKYLKKMIIIQTIGPDKLNQLRHVSFFKNVEGIHAHMAKHASILKPKFDKVISILEKELGGKGLASWIKPEGGYFISLNVMDNCARKIVDMAREAGVIFTKAGATFPYGRDPRDRNIRIAPTYPPIDELTEAIELLCICVQIACINSIIEG